MMVGECIVGRGGISMLLEDYFREYRMCVFGLKQAIARNVQNMLLLLCVNSD